MTNFSNTWRYIVALLKANVIAHHSHIRHTALMGAFMVVQNLIFFTMWIVFFGAVSEVRGWQLRDLAVMLGTVAMACGLALLTADGVRTIATKIGDGTIDLYLVRPRHPLPALLFSRSNSASIGDIVTGPIYWFAFGGVSFSDLPAMIFIAFLSASIFLSALIVFYSLAFWLKQGGRLSDQLFEILITFSSIPQHGQSIGIKIIIFSLIPSGFISILPISLIYNFDIKIIFIMIIFAAIYALLAITVFNFGVKYYSGQKQ